MLSSGVSSRLAVPVDMDSEVAGLLKISLGRVGKAEGILAWRARIDRLLAMGCMCFVNISAVPPGLTERMRPLCRAKATEVNARQTRGSCAHDMPGLRMASTRRASTVPSHDERLS